MPWEPNRNIRSLSPHGLKESSGFAPPALHDANCVGCDPMPPGILGPTPLGRGVSSPYMPSSSRPTRGAPQSMTPPHTASPHHYGADPGPRESDIITPRTRP
jgi:hypothetical protein